MTSSLPFKNAREVAREAEKQYPQAVMPNDIIPPAGYPVTQDSPARGGGFTTDQQNELHRLRQLVLDQNPFFTFYWNDAETPIAVDDFMKLNGGFTPTIDLMGEVPLHNGFFTGFSVVGSEALAATTGLQFRVYRDGVLSHVAFQITDHDNSGDGIVRARFFSSSEEVMLVDDSYLKRYYFKSGERIVVRVEGIQLPGYTDAASVHYLLVKVYYNFTSWTPEESVAQGAGGGSTYGYVPGGGGGGGEEPGNGGGGGILG